jgi:multiple RNA-binding domain-containing protein 1
VRDAPNDSKTKKRKREVIDEADPKLQEYLSVMLPASKAAKKDSMGDKQDAENTPRAEEQESDDEYEDIPSRKPGEPGQATRQSPTGKPGTSKVEIADTIARDSSASLPQDSKDLEPVLPAAAAAPSTTVDATDDDWLRSRTNRLLDLVDEDHVAPDKPTLSSHSQPVPADSEREEEQEQEQNPQRDHVDVTRADVPPAQPTTKGQDKDAILEDIHRTRRLFLRNLPYSATEDELRSHFEKYGEVEEVGSLPVALVSQQFPMMNPDRDSLYLWYLMRKQDQYFSRCFAF